MTEKNQPEIELLLNGEPYGANTRCHRHRGSRVHWKRRLLICVLTIETCFVLPKFAHGQFLSVFDSIFSSIQNDIGSSLGQINQIMQQTQKLYQTTLAPLAALNQARGFVLNSINSFRGQMNQIFNTSFTSAVTPGPQQFESILHSRLSSEIPALQTSFFSNYGTIRSIQMTDPKKNPNKQRRSFFWQRKPCLLPDFTKPTIAAEALQCEGQPWYRPSLLMVAIVVLAVLAILPTRANGQFGIDTAAILAALSKMQSLMNTFIATPLKTINQYEQSVAKYEQEVMYPLVAINQAKSSVMQFENQFNQVSGMFRVNVSSATLPQSQNLESLLLSRNAQNVPIVSGQFQNVYGVVMAQNAASPQMRTMTDMTDAQAQDAMKRAIEIDALADAELNEANQMGQQISQAAPGSAPILEAEADVWVVRANAYTQAALAELMRTRGIDLANQSKTSKLATTDNTNNNGLINGALTNR